MSDLDDPSAYSCDPDDFLGVIEEFPDQVRRGWMIGNEAEPLPSGDGIESICVLGMGGSGVAGDVVKAILAPISDLPVTVAKGYALPRWVGPSTLVFAPSYSGNTEETLETFASARRAGARIVVVTTGGALADQASDAGLPVISIPSGLQPRAAMGYLAMPMLAVIARMGLCPDLSADVDEALEVLALRSDACQRKMPVEQNEAKQIARDLQGLIPIVYGSEGLADVAAYRWKCQFNECSKVPSWWHSFPELNHNELVGWSALQEMTTKSLALVVLRHPGEHHRISKRIDITIPIVEPHVGAVRQVSTSATSTMAGFLDLVYVGDLAATYLAIAQGIDPTPVAVIESLKKKLAQG